jgi:hypothetical protein
MPQPFADWVRTLADGGLLSCSQEPLDVGVSHRLAGNAPFATRDVLDDDPGDLTDALAVDGGRRVGELLDQLPLLLGLEDPFDGLEVNQRRPETKSRGPRNGPLLDGAPPRPRSRALRR